MVPKPVLDITVIEGVGYENFTKSLWEGTPPEVYGKGVVQ